MAYKFSHETHFKITTRSDGPPIFPESFPTLSETFCFPKTFPPYLSSPELTARSFCLHLPHYVRRIV